MTYKHSPQQAADLSPSEYPLQDLCSLVASKVLEQAHMYAGSLLLFVLHIGFEEINHAADLWEPGRQDKDS